MVQLGYGKHTCRIGLSFVSRRLFANFSGDAFVVCTRMAESIWNNYGRTDDHIQRTTWFFHSPSDALAPGRIAARAVPFDDKQRDQKVVRARIAVLGRGTDRRLGSVPNGRLFLDAAEVAAALKTAPNVTVDLADFQSVSFAQVHFMLKHDSVLSPTGA